jgi:hypothetical protein
MTAFFYSLEMDFNMKDGILAFAAEQHFSLLSSRQDGHSVSERRLDRAFGGVLERFDLPRTGGDIERMQLWNMVQGDSCMSMTGKKQLTKVTPRTTI